YGDLRVPVAHRRIVMLGTPRPTGAKRLRRRRPLRTRLFLEPLEDRTLLAVSLTGTIFKDLNSNRAYDPGEPGVAAATAFLDVNGNGVLDQNADLQLSGPTGLASFSTLPSKQASALTGFGVNAMSAPLQVSGLAGPITNFQVHLNVQMA